MMKRIVILVALYAGFSSSAGCSECAGTPSCSGQPLVSTSGQLIVHKTGATVAGALLQFVRTGGIPLDSDTIRAKSDGEGFFTLRMGTVYTGDVVGDLTITPAAPFVAFTASDVTLRSSRIRGDGGYLGRLVVDPYLILVGELHDGRTGAVVPNAVVRMRRLSGGRVDRDNAVFDTDGGGRFAWIEPKIRQFGTITWQFNITLTDGSTYQLTQDVPILYRDGTIAFVLLTLPT